MPKKTYYLAEGKEDPIVVSWGFAWKNFSVSRNGQEIGTVENQKALREGKSIELEDGRNLFFQLKTGMNAYLDVQVDGKPLPGSGGDPRTKVKTAAIYTWVIGGLGLLVGVILVAVGFGVEEIGIPSAIAGAIFIGMGFWINTNSIAAIVVTIVLGVLSTLSVALVAIEGGGRVGGGMVIKVLWIVTLFRAISGAKELKKRKHSSPDILDSGSIE